MKTIHQLSSFSDIKMLLLTGKIFGKEYKVFNLFCLHDCLFFKTGSLVHSQNLHLHIMFFHSESWHAC